MPANLVPADTRAADLVVAELLTTAGFSDPTPRIERIRAMGRAVPSTLGLLITGYDDCQQALRSHALESDAEGAFAPLLGAKWRDNRAMSLLADSLLFLEGDAHNRLRKLVAGAFTPAAVAAWQPTIDSVAERLLGEVAAKLAAGEQVDLVEALARPLPIAVMAELLGLPHQDATRLRAMIGSVAEVFVGLAVDADALTAAHEIGVELDTYLRNALAAPATTTTPADAANGVIGRIALDTSEAVSDDDRVALAFILLAAGFETTAMLVANAMALLIEHPDTWRELAADPSIAAAVIEETLRLLPPAALTARVSTEPTVVAGTQIPSGMAVTLLLSGANRDPQRFDRPGDFLPARYRLETGAVTTPTTSPLSFGSGIHHCIGSVLARSEATAVLRRVDVLNLNPTDHLRVVAPIEWRPSIALRGVESLVVMAGPSVAPTTSNDVPQRHASPALIAHGLKRRLKTTALSARLGVGYGLNRLRRIGAKDDRKQQIADRFAEQSSARAVEVLGDLKGVMMKTGQLLSFVGVGMPEVAQRSLAALQSDAPPMPDGEAEAAIERAFGRSVQQMFAEWNPQPVAAASIGQVHRARLHDGREVAVKVQYPGVGDAIETDLADQARFTKLLGRLAMRGLDADTFAREVRLRIIEELDYGNEATQQAEFAARFAGHPVFRVPCVIPAFSNRVVLTSEWAQGQQWREFVDHAEQPVKDRVGEIIARFAFAGTRRYRHFNADPNPGNYLVHPNGEFVTFLDFGLSKKVSVAQDHSMWLLVDSIMDHRSAAETVAGSIEGGYLRPDHGLDPELMARFLYSTGDFYEQQPFTVTKEWFSAVAKRTFLFEGEFAAIRHKLNTQADYFLRDRVYWGMLSILAELEATADWRAINEEYRRNAPPSTPIGEAEARWISARANRFASK